MGHCQRDRLDPFMTCISTQYALCEEEETLDHLFTGGSFSKEVWTQVLSRLPGATIPQDKVHQLIRNWHKRWILKDDRLIWCPFMRPFGLYGGRKIAVIKKEARAAEGVISFILERVREWASVSRKVGSHNSSFFCFVGG